jgi:hypothetical protein
LPKHHTLRQEDEAPETPVAFPSPGACVVKWSECETAAETAAFLRQKGFRLSALRSTCWSAEEKNMLCEGLRQVSCGARVMHTKCKFYWFSHHVMDDRRTAGECKRALKMLIGNHPDWSDVMDA